MVSVTHYRKEAERCRELAAHSPSSDMASRWRALAADYDKLADALEESPAMMVGQRPAMQQQPMQQQQSKKTDDQ